VVVRLERVEPRNTVTWDPVEKTAGNGSPSAMVLGGLDVDVLSLDVLLALCSSTDVRPHSGRVFAVMNNIYIRIPFLLP